MGLYIYITEKVMDSAPFCCRRCQPIRCEKKSENVSLSFSILAVPAALFYKSQKPSQRDQKQICGFVSYDWVTGRVKEKKEGSGKKKKQRPSKLPLWEWSCWLNLYTWVQQRHDIHVESGSLSLVTAWNCQDDVQVQLWKFCWAEISVSVLSIVA